MVENNENISQENEDLNNDTVENESTENGEENTENVPVTEENQEDHNRLAENTTKKVTIADPINITPEKNIRLNPLAQLIQNLKTIFTQGPKNKNNQKLLPKRPPVFMQPKNQLVKRPPQPKHNGPLVTPKITPEPPKNNLALIKPQQITVIQPPSPKTKKPLLKPKKVASTPSSSSNVGSGLFFNQTFFETLLMVIIIIWLLRWLFGFAYQYGHK